jgi:hypothetical protein
MPENIKIDYQKFRIKRRRIFSCNGTRIPQMGIYFEFWKRNIS